MNPNTTSPKWEQAKQLREQADELERQARADDADVAQKQREIEQLQQQVQAVPNSATGTSPVGRASGSAGGFLDQILGR